MSESFGRQRAVVAETEAEALAMRETLVTGVPREAVGVWLSHNTGFDMSTLPPALHPCRTPGPHHRRQCLARRLRASAGEGVWTGYRDRIGGVL